LELPRQCGDAILREFVAQYGEKLASMRHIFEDMIDEKKARPYYRRESITLILITILMADAFPLCAVFVVLCVVSRCGTVR
jgi:hypothetical protein